MIEKEEIISKLKNECNNCLDCALGKTRNNIVFGDGKATAPIMLIGEAPGADEDATGTPFVGRAGKLLNSLLAESGLSRENELYICNTVKCRPPENRVPTPEEKKSCEKYLKAQIETVNPKVIVLCGATAAKSFIGDKLKISQVRGQWYKLFDKYDATIIFHPSYLLRNHSLEENSPRWLTKKDLSVIKEKLS